MMNTHDILPVIKAVLSDFRVIVTAVVVFVFMDLCAYIVRYRKKTKSPRAKRPAVIAAPAPAETSDENDEDDVVDDEE